MEGIASAVERWGYRAFPREEGDFGYGRLLVAIRKEPTERHFDPEKVRFRLRDASGDVRRRTASWRVPVEESGRLLPGSAALKDRHGKEVEFFTFGGTVDHAKTESAVVYVFDSPAPILEFAAAEETVSDQFAYEAEGTLGELEEQYDERWGRGFDHRLAEIEPLSLYIAILDAILSRYEKAPCLEKAFHTLYDALSLEKRMLQAADAWPKSSPELQELVLEDAGRAVSKRAGGVESPNPS